MIEQKAIGNPSSTRDSHTWEREWFSFRATFREGGDNDRMTQLPVSRGWGHGSQQGVID